MSKVLGSTPREGRPRAASLSVGEATSTKHLPSRHINHGNLMSKEYRSPSLSHLTLGELVRRNATLQGEVDTLKERVATMQTAIQKCENEVNSHQQNSDAWRRYARQLEQAVLAEKANSSKKAEEQEAELESLKTFLDTHDNVDPSSVSSQLVVINDLIEQMASELSLRWDLPRRKPVLPVDDSSRKRMEGILGPSLANMLLTCDPGHDGSTVLLQYAFQAAAVYWLSELFMVGTHKTKRYHTVTKLENKIRDGEIQPVYGRWRSLTHSYVRLTGGLDHEQEALNKYVDYMIIDMVDAMQLLGIQLNMQDHEITTSELNRPITEIANHTLKLATMVTTQTVSKDYNLYLPAWGDFNSALMEMPFSLPDTPAKDQVIATISLGMVTSGKPGRLQAQPQKRLLRKAMVVTEKMLFELTAPSQSHQDKREHTTSLGHEKRLGLSDKSAGIRSSPKSIEAPKSQRGTKVARQGPIRPSSTQTAYTPQTS